MPIATAAATTVASILFSDSALTCNAPPEVTSLLEICAFTCAWSNSSPPILFSAPEIPKATATPLLPPMPTAKAAATMSASISSAEWASTVTPPPTVSVDEMMLAMTSVPIMFCAPAPPPLTATPVPGVPLRVKAAAAAVALILEMSSALTVTPPVPVTPVSSTLLRVVPLMSLSATPAATATETELPPDSEAVMLPAAAATSMS